MNERIYELTRLTMEGKMYPESKAVEFDRMDIFLSKPKMTVKRLHDYVAAQEPLLTCYQKLPSTIALTDANIGGPYHNHMFENTLKMFSQFYRKPIDNLSTLEWQHATADYKTVIELGIKGLISKIEESRIKHEGNEEKQEFLECLKSTADTLIIWTEKFSEKALRLLNETENPEYRENLKRLSETLKKVPYNPADNFYEAVVSICMVFGYARDSLGTLDRTLYPYYKRDIESGTLTREEAKDILCELFLIQQANTPKSGNFTRGGESHFCIGANYIKVK